MCISTQTLTFTYKHSKLQIRLKGFSVEYSKWLIADSVSTAEVSCSIWRLRHICSAVIWSNWSDSLYPPADKERHNYCLKSFSAETASISLSTQMDWSVFKRWKNRMWNGLDLLCCSSCMLPKLNEVSSIQDQESDSQKEKTWMTRNVEEESKSSLPLTSDHKHCHPRSNII